MFDLSALGEARPVKKFMEDGSEYEGYMEDGLPNGHGKMMYPDGEVYDGEWHEGIRHGKGKNQYVNGSVFDGHWDRGRFNGYGEYLAGEFAFFCTWMLCRSLRRWL